MIDQKTIKTLEFNNILDLLAKHAISNSAKEAIFDILPCGDIDTVNELLDTTEQMYLAVNKYFVKPIVPFDDARECIGKASAGSILHMGELLKVRRLIRSARIAKTEINSLTDDSHLLKAIVAPLFIDSDLEKIIGDSIATETEMKDSASDKLRTLRRQIVSADAKLKEKLASYTRSSSLSKYLQDNLVTQRNGRFVLPVKSECRSSIPGLIHDHSATGATVFIEPLPVVELNNELKSLQLQEAQEIERILQMLSALTAECANNLLNCQKICTMLDIVHAKMSFSTELKATKPNINDNGFVDIKKGRHPLIDKNSVVPVDITLGDDYKMLLITGPNTGGKTVCLKTIGLFCAMACCGLFIPCQDDSTVSIFDHIYCNIGDDQSILNSLSTFSSHILNITHITNNITNKSLVLLDELGGGTDPAEGSALAIGIIKYLEMFRTSGVITTHYSELKEYAITSNYIENACMQFDNDTLKPTYKLIVGLAGGSNALKISKSLGLNDYILEKAYDAMDKDKIAFENILASAEKAKSDAMKEYEETLAIKRQIESERQMIAAERKQIQDKIQKINEIAKQETRRKIGGLVEDANDIIEQMNELVKKADAKSLLEAKQLRNKLEEMQYSTLLDEEKRTLTKIEPNSLKIGDDVYVDKLHSEGKVLQLANKRGEITVAIGSNQIRVKMNEIFQSEVLEQETKNVNSFYKKMTNNLKKSNARKQGGSGVNKFLTNVDGGSLEEEKPKITHEIKVLGHTVAEAIEVVEEAIMTSTNPDVILKIVHGKGTGALGRGLQQHLKKLQMVKSIRYGKYGEGDNGVTFVEFK